MNENGLDNIKRWLLKLLTGTITPEEQAWLDAWRKRSAENQQLVDSLTGSDFIRRALLDHNKAKQQASWRRLYRSVGYRHSSLRVKSLRWRVAAVVLVLVVGTAAWLYLRGGEPSERQHADTPIIYMSTRGYTIEGSAVKFSRYVQSQADRQVHSRAQQVGYTEIAVPMGGEYRITLADSTRLHLNSGTTLRIPDTYSAESRSVYIDGEAYMEVRHDEAHPFTVKTRRMEVKVLGTKFNIDDYAGESHAYLTLVDGKVETVSSGRKATLLPGQEAVATATDMEMRHADVYEATAWHSERIVFVNRTIEDIMSHLARWYNFKPAYADERVRQMRMTIDIDRHETFRQVAVMIEKTNGISININKNRVLLSGKQ